MNKYTMLVGEKETNNICYPIPVQPFPSIEEWEQLLLKTFLTQKGEK